MVSEEWNGICPWTGKIIYSSKYTAEESMHNLRGAKREEMMAYICGHCGYFHKASARGAGKLKKVRRKQERYGIKKRNYGG